MRVRLLFILLIMAVSANGTLPPETFYQANIAKSGSVDDAYYGPFSIGFNFDYFGSTKTQFYVSSNGTVLFNGNSSYSNTSIPSSGAPNDVICAFWDDLILPSEGVIYYQTIGSAPNRKCVIQCTNQGFFSSNVLLGTYLVILYESSNDIQIQYRIIVDHNNNRSFGSSATIGIENSTGTIGYQYSYNTTSVSSEQAIRFVNNGGTSYTINSNAVYDGILLGDGHAPSIPQLTSPARTAIVPQQPTLDWAESDYATSYDVKYSTSSDLGGATTINITDSTQYTFSSPLSDGTTYYWAIFAKNDTGTTWSEIYQFTASSNPPPYANPQTVWTTKQVNTTIQLEGTGGYGNLSGIISTLPANGTLYQYDNGSRGTEIISVPTDLTDSQNRLFYYIPDDTTGVGLGNFEFKLRDDSAVESSASTIQVNIYSAPIAQTDSVINITTTSADIYAEVIDSSESAVTAKGICYGTSPYPTVGGDKTDEGSGIGAFTSSLTGLTTETTYYARAYAQNADGIGYGNEISFSTAGDSVTISGITSVANVILSYTDGTAKEDTADGSGNYSFKVAYNWSGSVIPTLTGYNFSPDSTTYSNLTADQTNQDYTATPITYTVSGNVGVASAVLIYTDVEVKADTADASGDFSFTVSYDWSGTVTPSLAGYTFTPGNRVYSNVLSDQLNQDFTATPITYTISGNVGLADVILSYTDGTDKADTSDGSGNYSFTVSYKWSGSVIPSKEGYTFAPDSAEYIEITSNQTGQNFSPTLITYTISGTILDSNLSPIQAVYMSTGLSDSVFTDVSGNYTITVPYNWSGSVIPLHEGYTFTPDSTVYTNVITDQTNEDFLALLNRYTISGAVVDSNHTGFENVYMSGFTDSVFTDSNGQYSGTVEYNWSGNITPVFEGYYFSPSQHSYSNVKTDQEYDDFTITPIRYTISGNAGLSSAVLNYYDGSAKTDSADTSGAYSFTVSYKWSGTVVPTYTGYIFNPDSMVYTELTSSQSDQNYSATLITYTITGAVILADHTPIENVYMDCGLADSVLTDSLGQYSITVPYNWSGTVTPVLEGFTFDQSERTYSNVLSDQEYDDYIATPITYTISGNAGAPLALLHYSDGTAKLDTANIFGNYSFQVSYKWSGVVRPTAEGYAFDPDSMVYTDLLSDQTDQNYTSEQIHTISGTIVDQKHQPLPDVYMSGAPDSILTDSNGYYTCILPVNWSGYIKPVKGYYLFTPDSLIFDSLSENISGQDFIGIDLALDVDDDNNQLPTQFSLNQNYPNPFNPTTTFSFELPVRSFITFEIFNIAGQKIKTLAKRDFDAGIHQLIWDAADYSSGIYLYRIKSDQYNATKKMILLK